MKKAGLAMGAMLVLSSPVTGQDSGLDADAAAGKILFEAGTNRGGCIRCHGPEGLGSEKNTSYAGNNIQGKSAEDIRLAIMALPMMWQVKLSDAETEQVAAYLKYLLTAKK